MKAQGFMTKPDLRHKLYSQLNYVKYSVENIKHYASKIYILMFLFAIRCTLPKEKTITTQDIYRMRLEALFQKRKLPRYLIKCFAESLLSQIKNL